jgi:glutamyl-tRNA synthetase
MAQFVEWFDLDRITSSAAQFNTEKLNWLNAHYIKLADDARLGQEIRRRLAREGVSDTAVPDPAAIAALYKDRVHSLNELADCAHPFYVAPHPAADLVAQHLGAGARAALLDFRSRLAKADFSPEAWAQTLKETLAASGLKMPQVAIPLRVVLLGQTQSPAIDRVLAAMGRDEVLKRLDAVLA